MRRWRLLTVWDAWCSAAQPSYSREWQRRFKPRQQLLRNKDLGLLATARDEHVLNVSLHVEHQASFDDMKKRLEFPAFEGENYGRGWILRLLRSTHFGNTLCYMK